ncbi:interleukin-8-like [Tiliqua scincoides]|uniref:interleukin-8-like n=1 Tax=Tiliqua scincoides TaxID=71010 RepID=UPI003461E7AF
MNAKAAVCAVLALFLLFARLTEGVPLAQMGSELRCQCVSTHHKFIHPKYIQDVRLIQSGPHCKDVEVIATLKDGREVCLEHTAPWVKRIIKAILDKAQANAESQL